MDWKEFRFNIDGETNGEKITPTSIPLARLVLYLHDLSILLGHSDSVHLMKIDDGSAEPVFFIDPREESQIISQVRNAQRGAGGKNANGAYKRIDKHLKEDNATGRIFNASTMADIIEFPGNKVISVPVYQNIRERATVTGRLKRVGGFDTTIPVHLLRSDGAILHCEASEATAEALAPFYSKYVRLHGIATYSRGADRKWKMDNFKIQSFDETPLIEESFSETMEKLRSLEGNDWANVVDPLEELQKLRR